MRDVVITGGTSPCRTGRHRVKAALERAALFTANPDDVIIGQVLQADAGQNPARQAAVAAGSPMTVPSITLNKVCLSGLDAIALAAELLRVGELAVWPLHHVAPARHGCRLAADLLGCGARGW